MDAFDQRCIVEAKCKKEDLSPLSAALSARKRKRGEECRNGVGDRRRER